MVYLTVICNSGGYHGHRLKDMLGGITIAKLFDFTYAHTSDEYLEFFGIGYGEISVKDLNKDIKRITIKGPEFGGLSYKKAVKIFGRFQKKFKGKECLIVLERAMRIHPCQTIQWYNDGLINKNIFEEVTREISAKFDITHRNRNTYFNKNEINIAMHINRGIDYLDSRHHRNPSSVRYMFPMEYYANIVFNIAKNIKNNTYKIHIYTEKFNSEEIVNTFNHRKNIILHLGPERNYMYPYESIYLNSKRLPYILVCQEDRQIHNIFYHMVKSDILVTCNSSFSVMAGHFRSSGFTIYHPHTHYFDLPRDRYIATDINGNFDTTFLKFWHNAQE